MILPPRVRQGDTVAIVSPSAPAVAWWPHRVERGRAYLQGLGLRTRLMPNAAAQDGWLAGTPQQRADDITAAFADPEASVVLCGIGGNHANQVAPLLDYDLIRANPKVFQGYSDIAVLHWAIQKHAGLSTFYGPALTVGLAEFPEVLSYTDTALRAAWFGDQPLRCTAAPEWTDELLDFFQQLDLTRPRRLAPSSGWVSVREGVAEGPLQGGCLETICWHLKGSTLWLDLDGAVLLLETSEEAPSPAHIDGYLTDLAQLGVLDAIAGLVVARPYGYDDEQAALLWQVVAKHTVCPVLANVDCGHTDPMLTLPLGQPVRVDVAAGTLETLAPPTRA